MNEKEIQKIKKLKPDEIAKVKMDKDMILYVSFHKPIIDSEMDYKVALYIESEIKKLEKTKGRYVAVFADINGYNRLDSPKHLGMTNPSLKARKLHSEMYKNSIVKRIAYYKKDASRIIEALVRMVTVYHGKQVRLFADREKAIKWLREVTK